MYTLFFVVVCIAICLEYTGFLEQSALVTIVQYDAEAYMKLISEVDNLVLWAVNGSNTSLPSR